nr:retrovirus-related Pol polyprotein from transposon TNT 1-94 [Tanacetum cinerariifolium]
MNYQPVTAGNQSNPSVGFQDKFDAKEAGEEGYRDLSAEFEDYSEDSINKVNAAGTLVPAVGQNSPNSTNIFSAAGPSNATASPTHEKYSFIDASQLLDDLDMPELEDITYSNDEDGVGAEADFNNLETSITVSPIPRTRVHKDQPVKQIISDLSLATQTKSMSRVAKDQVTAGNQSNPSVGFQDKFDAKEAGEEGYRDLSAEFEDYSEDSINKVNAAGTLVPAVGQNSPNSTNIFSAADSLGKFDGKVDEGFLVGYSVSSKAFKVFNSRTHIVQEPLHVNFLENKPDVAGSVPTWLFDIDSLTKTMNYQPVTAGNQSNPSV